MTFLELYGAIGLGVFSAKVGEDFFIIAMQKREARANEKKQAAAYRNLASQLASLEDTEGVTQDG